MPKSHIDDVITLTIGELKEICDFVYENEHKSYIEIMGYVNDKYSTRFNEDDIIEISLIGVEAFIEDKPLENELPKKSATEASPDDVPY